jgi:hypothetical protein
VYSGIPIVRKFLGRLMYNSCKFHEVKVLYQEGF